MLRSLSVINFDSLRLKSERMGLTQHVARESMLSRAKNMRKIAMAFTKGVYSKIAKGKERPLIERSKTPFELRKWSKDEKLKCARIRKNMKRLTVPYYLPCLFFLVT